MFRTSILFALILSFGSSVVSAQEVDVPSGTPVETAPAEDEREAVNSIFLEGLGAGLAYSLNYERMLHPDVGVRLGFSYLSVGASTAGPSGTTSADATFLTFPITASYVGVSSGSHALELGGGATITYASGSAGALGVSSSGSGVAPIGTLFAGYRLQPRDGGFQFRAGLAGLMGAGLSLSSPDPDAVGVLPWAYLSVGASF